MPDHERRMPKEELEKHIIDLLQSQRICVLATCKDNIPRATPVEYYSEGMALYIMLEKGRTINNIRSNPEVSVAIFTPYEGLLSLKGLQIIGKAKILTSKDPEYGEVVKSYEKKKEERERELREVLPGWKSLEMIQIKAEIIDLFDASLATRDFAIKQTWKY